MSLLRFLGFKGGRVVTSDEHRQAVDYFRLRYRKLAWGLRTTGIANGDELPLEYFFYTNSERKAQTLASALRDLGYSPEIRPTASSIGELLVTGWTTPIALGEDNFGLWAKKMYTVGFEHDCKFNGFGAHGRAQPNPSLERP